MPTRAPRPVCALLFFFVLIASFSSAQQIRKGIYHGMPVTYTLQHGKAIFQGDIILEKVSAFNPQQPPPPSYGIDYAQYLWPKVGTQYQIPYVIQSGTGDLTNLNAAISQFNATFSNIQFVAHTSETDYVNFYFDPNQNNGACEVTGVGRIGGEQQVNGAGGSFNPCALGTILHEMGHTIGLWHEQSRADRDTYVSVNYNNLIKGSISNFNPIYDNAQTFGTLYDYASIMEYPAFSFSRNGGPAIESIPAGIPLSNYLGYSATDIDGIERLYGSAPTAITVTSNPPGLQVIVDGATVTTPQTFTNWALYSTHTLNVATGVQSQAGNIVNSNPPVPTTFYYTYGRWNDSTAASHTITVLPGNGEPSTPATSPAVTTYSANFVQLVSYAATVYPTGTGSVTPTPAPQSYPGSSLLFYTARQQATLTAAPIAGQNFYEFNNAYFWLPGGLGANPKTFYVPDTGLNVNTTAEFSPNPVYTVNVTPNAFSSGLYIYGDTFFYDAPKNYSQFYDSTWTPGSTHTVGVDALIYPYSSNTRFAFDNWNDGSTNTTDTIVLPSTSATYTATLTPQYYVTDYVNESCAGSINVSPTSPDGFYPSGDALTFTETPNAGWTFTEWQYDLSGNSASQPLTVTDEVLVTADYNVNATPFSLTSLTPAAAVAGGPNFTLILNGTGFTATTVVSVNGTFPAVKFISSTQISVPVTATQIAKAGAFQVWTDSFPSGASCAAFYALPFTVADSPILTPSPLSLAFSPQALGTTAAGKVVKLTNTSASAVTINSVTSTPYFPINGKTCSSSLAAGASCTVTVGFTPVVTGAITGSLVIADSAPDSPQIISITATAEQPITLTPATLAFGTETVGHTTAAKTVTLTNNQSAALTLGFSTSGNYAVSSSGTTCGASLAAKAKCNIAVTFTPTANGSINGAITITDQSGPSPQLVALSGTGTGGATAPLTFNPATLAFNPQSTGTTSPAKQLTVKNSSTSVVTIMSIASSGDFSATGSGAKPCAANVKLSANGTCTLSVTFSPTLESTGTINGAIVVTDNSAPNQQVLDTKGTSVLPLGFAPATLNFAPQTVQTASAGQTVTLTNNLAATLNPVISGNGEFAAAPGGTNPCTSALASRASCTFVVTFTPSAVGTRAGVISVTDTADPGAQAFTVSGTGQ